MRIVHIRLTFVLIGLLSMTLTVNAKTLHVSCANEGQTGLDGKSVATAYATIQEAVDVASDGDTIIVEPGEYATGGKTFSHTYKTGELAGQTRTCLNRVYIDKKLTIVAASDDPAATVIRGAHDTLTPQDGNALGIGPGAIRCVRVDSSGVGTVLKGFTLADGCAQAVTEEGDVDAGRPGGISGVTGSWLTYVVDCVITNCTAARGGALRYITAVRSKIIDCKTHGGSAAARHCNLFHCLIVGNSTKACALTESRVVNTAIVASDDTGDNTTGVTMHFYNSLVLNNAARTVATTDYAVNSAFDSSPTISSGSGNFVGKDPYAFVSPLSNDWRLRAGSPVATLGSPANITAAITASSLSATPAIVELWKSLDGVTIDPSSSVIAAGPYQSAVTVATGALQFSKPMTVGGTLVKANGLYAFSETAPAVFSGKAYSAVGTPIYHFSRNSADGLSVYPDTNDVLTCGFPPTGRVVTNGVYFANKVIYVASDGTDDDADGRGASAAMPFRTLQYAVDNAVSRTVIFAAAGDYKEGGRELYGVSNRVAITQNVRIIGAGAGRSFIYGASDRNDPAGDGYGRGPAAMRCAAFQSVSAAIQGFTLTGGRGNYDSSAPTADKDWNRGGIAFSNNNAGHLIDCTVTDGIAYRGGFVAGYLTCIRCIFTNGMAIGGGLIRNGARLYSCLVCGNSGSSGSALDNGSYAYASTILTGDGVAAAMANIDMDNSIVIGGSTESRKFGVTSGCLFYGFSSVTSSTGDGYTVADPVFVDPANDDYRVGSVSPAVTAASLLEDWWKFNAKDLNGNPFVFTGGVPVAGAFQRTVPTLVVTASSDSSRAGTLTNVGTNFVEEGESLVISDTTGARPITGFVVDGETVPGATYTYIAPTDGLPAVVAVTPIYLTNLYVNANIEFGRDSNDGFSPETPKLTLAGVMALALRGDTVHAAKGTYDRGTMAPPFTNAAPSTILARVHVPIGVTLVGDKGAGCTVIKGDAATSADANGLGADAIRCATVAYGATLKGFTLTGGRVSNAGSGEQDDYGGGGVLAQNYGTKQSPIFATIADCIITNCIAPRGGAGHGYFGKYINCRIVGNKATATSSAMYRGTAFGCFFADNTEGQLFRYCNGLHNCTLADPKGSFPNPSGYFGTPTFDNCVFFGYHPEVSTVTHCIIVGSAGKNVPVDANTFVSDVSALGLNDDCTPASKTSLVVDAGDNSLLSAELATDVAGGQRIYNRTVDLGAFEYDWRSDYAADVFSGSAMVDTASAGTAETVAGESVTLGQGEFGVTFSAVTGGHNATYTVPLEVLGDGTLTLVLNGTETNTYTKADGAVTLKFKNALSKNMFRYSYDADDEGVLLGRADWLLRGAILLVR